MTDVDILAISRRLLGHLPSVTLSGDRWVDRDTAILRFARELAAADGFASDSLAAENKRLSDALGLIARHTGSDDPCRHLVDIAREALRV